MGPAARRWTIERRGNRFVAMAWTASPADGPLEVRVYDTLAQARASIELATSGAIRWRPVGPDEAPHAVELAGDIESA